jgi:glutamine synthetase type III
MSTLIDSMVALAILGTGAAMLTQQYHHVETANTRAVAVESVGRALDQEMELFRACTDRACVNELAGRANEQHSSIVSTWTGADIERVIEEGAGGTVKVTLKASVPGSRIERKLVALIAAGAK